MVQRPYQLRGWRSRVFRVAALLAGIFALTACVEFFKPTRYERLALPAGTSALHVLLIGNSLTYYNDLPGLLQQLSAHEAAPIQFEAVTWPYASLKFHWNLGKAQAKIHAQHWDYVILQEFSNLPVTDPAKSLKYFKLFNAEIQSVGAQTIISQNWTRRGNENDYSAMLATYDDVLRQTHATLAPIGAAWQQCEQTRPDIKLFTDDRHPTDAGTYLTACVLYAVLYHKNPDDLPMDLLGPALPQPELIALRHIAGHPI